MKTRLETQGRSNTLKNLFWKPKNACTVFYTLKSSKTFFEKCVVGFWKIMVCREVWWLHFGRISRLGVCPMFSDGAGDRGQRFGDEHEVEALHSLLLAQVLPTAQVGADDLP